MCIKLSKRHDSSKLVTVAAFSIMFIMQKSVIPVKTWHNTQCNSTLLPPVKDTEHNLT